MSERNGKGENSDANVTTIPSSPKILSWISGSYPKRSANLTWRPSGFDHNKQHINGLRSLTASYKQQTSSSFKLFELLLNLDGDITWEFCLKNSDCQDAPCASAFCSCSVG